jgi:hypothetical protein
MDDEQSIRTPTLDQHGGSKIRGDLYPRSTLQNSVQGLLQVVQRTIAA